MPRALPDGVYYLEERTRGFSWFGLPGGEFSGIHDRVRVFPSMGMKRSWRALRLSELPEAGDSCAEHARS